MNNAEQEQQEKLLCPFLVTTIHNMRIVGDELKPKNEMKRLQPCMKERCMAYDTDNGSCKRL
jgi:hypothetical protein